MCVSCCLPVYNTECNSENTSERKTTNVLVVVADDSAAGLNVADKVVSQSSCTQAADAVPPSTAESSRKPLSCVSVRDPRTQNR